MCPCEATGHGAGLPTWCPQPGTRVWPLIPREGDSGFSACFLSFPTCPVRDLGSSDLGAGAGLESAYSGFEFWPPLLFAKDRHHLPV